MPMSRGHDGPVKEFFNDGTVAAAGVFAAGAKTGEWRYYFRSGKLKASGRYEDGTLVGAWKWYRETGELMQSGGFDDAGKKTGVWKRFHRNGELHDEGKYSGGEKTGTWKEFDTRGELRKSTAHEGGTVITETAEKRGTAREAALAKVAPRAPRASDAAHESHDFLPPTCAAPHRAARLLHAVCAVRPSFAVRAGKARAAGDHVRARRVQPWPRADEHFAAAALGRVCRVARRCGRVHACGRSGVVVVADVLGPAFGARFLRAEVDAVAAPFFCAEFQRATFAMRNPRAALALAPRARARHQRKRYAKRTAHHGVRPTTQCQLPRKRYERQERKDGTHRQNVANSGAGC